jgi:hypothetical protein
MKAERCNFMTQIQYTYNCMHWGADLEGPTKSFNTEKLVFEMLVQVVILIEIDG